MARKTHEEVTYSAKDSQRLKSDIMKRVSDMFDDCADWTGLGVITITLRTVDDNGDREVTAKAEY